jgi:hypothetical protein
LLLVLPAIGFIVGSRPSPELPAEPTAHPDSRLERHGAIWHCHLAGSALQRGFACGKLTAPMMANHENELFSTLQELVPWFPFRHLILGLVTFNNRDLDAFLRAEELQAIAGLARGYRAAGDPNAHVGPAFGRILGYHALHDASQYLIDNPLITAPQVGCSAVALGASRSADGHLLVGRLFDFEGGRSFDFDKVVYTVAPAAEGGIERLRYMNVAWGGVHGAVTGMNEASLWVSINAGVSDHFAYRGRPLVIAVHHVLETCRTIDQAIAHLTSQPVFVSESVLLASAQDGHRAVCLELAPGRHHVREMSGDRLVATNHFEHPGWASDGANTQRRAEGTTMARSMRLHELIESAPQHTPAALAELLRDRRGVGGSDLGFGHRSGVNAWIGAHLVVADLDACILWVAEPEHGLGGLLPFGLEGPRAELEALPPSIDLPLFAQQGRTWKPDLERTRHLVARRDPAAASRCRELIERNPQHYEPYVLLATCTEDRAAAAALLRLALERRPAYASERRTIEARLQRLEAAGTAR